MRSLFIFCLTGLLLTACTTPNPGAPVRTSGGPPPAETLSPYQQAAVATGTARAWLFEEDMRNVERTALAATQQAGLAEQTATAGAATAQALAIAQATGTARAEAQMTQAALAEATATARVEAQWTAQAYAQATATQVAVQNARATAAIVATQTALRLQAEAAAAQQQVIFNAALVVLGLIGLCVVVYVLYLWGRTANRNFAKAGSLLHYGPHRNPLILADNGPAQVLINPLTNTAALTTLDGHGHLIAAELPEMMRHQAMLAVLAVLHQQAQHSPFAPVPGAPDRKERWRIGSLEHETQVGALPSARPSTPITDTPTPAIYTAQAVASTPQLALPDWAHFTAFDWSAQRLLIGLGPGGAPIALDPEQDPHVMVAGTSGSGKTRHGLTVLVAGALRLGWQVVVLNRAGADFGPLAQHPALHLFDDPAAPLHYLAAAAQEVDRRNGVLRAANVSTWTRLPEPAPRVLMVVDELVALTQTAAAREEALALWRAVVHIASAGRKCGIHLALATTDPTHKTLGRFGLVARDNCARVAFRLRGNQAVLPGEALDLGPRRFLALTSHGNTPQPGAAFAPSDDELRAWVGTLPADSPCEQPAFLLTQPENPTLPSAASGGCAKRCWASPTPGVTPCGLTGCWPNCRSLLLLLPKTPGSTQKNG